MPRALLVAVLALSASCTDPGGGAPPSITTVGQAPTATPGTAAITTAPGASAAPTSPVAATTCRAPATPMVPMTEGPYYRANPPQRTVLYTPGVAGTRLLLSGQVLSRSCAPIANARVDFWQADGTGAYDNAGYGFRGYQLTDAQGRYELDTVVPGLYPGRTEHIHVKVTPPGGATITSQLYFPTSTQNERDSIFSRAMLVTLTPGTPLRGRFDFIVDLP
ncbi:MAG TPA: dioxygenase [Candidatus Limnocylindria bacterium]|nr:dioxygenase [Candidatus Limnocylindria bacterium]